jgi:uridine kinase
MAEKHSSSSKPCVIVIAGSVGSGKSTSAVALSKMSRGAPILAFDRYEKYAEWPSDMQQWMDDGFDPDQIRVPKLKEDLLALIDGKTSQTRWMEQR